MLGEGEDKRKEGHRRSNGMNRETARPAGTDVNNSTIVGCLEHDSVAMAFG